MLYMLHLGKTSGHPTFLSAMNQLDELEKRGITTIYLPNILSETDYRRLNPALDQLGNGLSVTDEARLFIDKAHALGLSVVVGIPAFATPALALQHPELIARDERGKPFVPGHRPNMVLFRNNEGLLVYYHQLFEMLVNELQVDGFRVNTAPARPHWFWEHFIHQYPNHAWIAESYTHEDVSSRKNVARDMPEQFLRIGFDAVYDPIYRFRESVDADAYLDSLLRVNGMLERANRKSSLISSFRLDRQSAIAQSSALMQIFQIGLMFTQPWTNPVIDDQLLSAYRNNVSVGSFLNYMLSLRKKHSDLFSLGLFIPVPVRSNDEHLILAFARQIGKKVFLVVANKDFNARQRGVLQIPGIKASGRLKSLTPSYGSPSHFSVEDEQIRVDLGAGRFHLFEIDVPKLSAQLKYYA